MSDSLELLEQRLASAYAEQASHYDCALRILDSQNLISDGEVDESWVFELQSALNEVSAIDIAMAEDKRAWQQSAQPPGPHLRTILDGLAKRIRILAEHVDGRVAHLNAKRRQIMPEIDGFIQQRRMLKAYDTFSRSP